MPVSFGPIKTVNGVKSTVTSRNALKFLTVIWVIMAIAYFDTYERRDGEWLFVRRNEKHWYAADWEKRPTAPFTGWPSHPNPPDLPGDFDAWNLFWTRNGAERTGALTALPTGETK